MCFRSRLAALSAALLLGAAAAPAGAPGRDWEPVELVGRASDFRHQRYYPSYYWAEDFTFLLKEDGGKTWRIISREPTPAYEWRMGPTYTGLKVDWKANPRVKVVGVKAIDRIPEKFPGLKLDDANLATALLVFVETKPGMWKEFYVNNWFHVWGPRADRKVHAYYADRPAPYDVYGFARAQAAPFDNKSQAIIDQHKGNPSLMFRGRVRTNKDRPFGYELELLDLIGRNVKSGGATILHGDARSIPRLESKK